MRTFVALNLTDETSDALGDIAAQMAYQDKSHALRWVDEGNYHVTLAFLGDISNHMVDGLIDRIDHSVQVYGVESMITGFTPFPESKPKLIAGMLATTESIIDIHAQVMSCINAEGLTQDKRRFLPHITLGRFRHSKNRYGGVIPLTLEMDIEFNELVVYESVLRYQGAEYISLYSCPVNYLDLLSTDES